MQDSIKNEAQDIESAFAQKLEQIFALIKNQWNDIHLSLNKTTQTAETALEFGVTLQEESKTLQKEITDLRDKYLILAFSTKENNIQFRGLEEGVEGMADLSALIGNWLAKSLQTEELISLVIMKAYRMGPKKPGRQLPRDVLITLAEPQIKCRILNIAQEKNGWMYFDKNTGLPRYSSRGSCH